MRSLMLNLCTRLARSMDGDPIHEFYPQVAFSIPQSFISSLLVALVPFFNIIGPSDQWIFRGFDPPVTATIHKWGLHGSR